MITPEQLSAIDEVMDCFEFGRVATCMEALEWRWCGGRVPEEHEIRASARRQMKAAFGRFNRNPNINYSSTGGFEVRVDEHSVSLNFVVSDWVAEIDQTRPLERASKCEDLSK